ncbi:MAG: hypothetical protein Q8T04_07895, partial [Bacteroidota bacterium]|nr:hypothetical protein [Bacteroidota bacterium]
VSGFKFQVGLELGYWLLNILPWIFVVPNLKFKVSSFRFQVSGFKFQVGLEHGYWLLNILPWIFVVPSFRFQVPGFKFCASER